MAKLKIIEPKSNVLFKIDTKPSMPVIICRAEILPGSVDEDTDTDTGLKSTFKHPLNWSIEITETILASSCPCSRIGKCSLTVKAENISAYMEWKPTFDTIQGGDAVITVKTTYMGLPLADSVKIRIRGDNPFPTDVSTALGGQGSVGDMIARLESRWRQFDPAHDYMPLLGSSGGGDVGIMQLCSSASCQARWNWRQNIAEGLAILNKGKTEARRHLNQHRVNNHYPNNLGLDDDDVVLRETIQLYNGGYYWKWNTKTNQWDAFPPIPNYNYVKYVLEGN